MQVSHTVLTQIEPWDGGGGCIYSNHTRKGGSTRLRGVLLERGPFFFLLPENVLSLKPGIAVHMHGNTKEAKVEIL